MTTHNPPPKLTIISCGPGGQDDITVRAFKKIKDCDVVIGSRRMLAAFASKNQVHIIFTGKTDDFKEIIQAHHRKKIGILVTGDAGIYSLTRKILDMNKDWDIEIIPGVSSLQSAFAAIGETWEEVDTFSFHGRDITDLEKVLQSHKAAVFCDRHNNAPVIIRQLFPEKLDRRCYITQNLSLKDEKIIEVTSLNDLAYVEPVSHELLILIR